MDIPRDLTNVTLYERLGGSAGVRSLIDDIIEAHMQNPTISARFLPYREDPERLETAKRHLCDFFAAGSGGPDRYAGRTMPDAHRGMNVSEAEYMAATDDILTTMARHGHDEAARQEVLAIIWSLKEEIIHA
ncbi:group 1 truncated hemoglobin [Rhodosalinus halophilus]|uniref:Group 1 truncated hemoglobin n=1 Tax=Rhodosalinus halophilus TaxID=2259333 RepID=A0A365U4P1_9RHOB|nr:group 1 truncated hemoglobin [Rhodosalinus halophilus]RBI83133.1 group 1 truncated hemoglobin [Rhodosalinus halophilus]